MEAAFERVSITLEGLFTARVFVAIVSSPYLFGLAQFRCPAYFKPIGARPVRRECIPVV
jgi:hypothetical protein